MSDSEYPEPFRMSGEAPVSRHPQFESLDRVQEAVRGYLDETLLSEDEWDRFATLRQKTSTRQRTWRLIVAGADTSCLSSRATRRLSALLDCAESIPQVYVHTFQGTVRVRRRFKDRFSQKVHYLMAEYIEPIPPTGETLAEFSERHIAALFRMSPRVLAVEFPKAGKKASYTITNVCAFAQTPIPAMRTHEDDRDR